MTVCLLNFQIQDCSRKDPYLQLRKCVLSLLNRYKIERPEVKRKNIVVLPLQSWSIFINLLNECNLWILERTMYKLGFIYGSI